MAPIGNPTGKTKDFGVLLATKDDKYSFRVVKFKSSVQSANSQLSGSAGLGSIIQQGLRFRNVFKYQLGVYTLDTANQPQDRNNWQPDPTRGETQDDADRRRNASIAAWDAIQAKLMPTGFFDAWGFDPNQVYAYVSTPPQGYTVTADTVSKGYEFELTANPLPSWRIAFNASTTEATRANVGGSVLDEYVNYIDQQMAGPAGEMRQFSGGPTATTTAIMWNAFRGNYTLMKLQENAAAPEIRKWRYNVVTNYSFKKEGIPQGRRNRWLLPLAGRSHHRLPGGRSHCHPEQLRFGQALSRAVRRRRRSLDQLRTKAHEPDQLEDPVERSQRVRQGRAHSDFRRTRREHVGVGPREAEPGMVRDEYVFLLIRQAGTKSSRPRGRLALVARASKLIHHRLPALVTATAPVSSEL